MKHVSGAWLLLAASIFSLTSCSKSDSGGEAPPVASSANRASASAHGVVVADSGPPVLLYLPEGGDLAPPDPAQRVLPGPWQARSGRCPAEMVDIVGLYCIDRYEASLVDSVGSREISPYFHPTRVQTQRTFGRFSRGVGDGATERARAMPVPVPPSWQLREEFEPRAVSRQGVVPNGYMHALLADRACRNAGKRLCSLDEWVRACRGEQNRQFPYGDRYEQGRCNVFREAHPAHELHGNASINHTDPRLNRVTVGGKPLLRPTGTTPDCVSTWGADAVHDLVGNLDEWIDDPDGVFVGGFYSRSTRAGCEARVSSHGPTYFDYSLGVRCCQSPR